MNKHKVYEVLSSQYPGKPIKFLPDNNPSEIICELGGDGKSSQAIAIIDCSVQHYHRKTTETYHVLKGDLTVSLNGEECFVEEGQSLVIEPGTLHWAKGDAVWVRVECTPPWVAEDHILSPVKE